MPKVIGEAEQIDLHAFYGQDINFDLEWWEEDGTTKRLIELVEGKIKTPDDAELVLDLVAYSTFTPDPFDNTVSVLVPAAVVNALSHRSGVWYFALKESTSDEQRTVCFGNFKLFGRPLA